MEVDLPQSSAMEATKYSKYVSLMGVKALELSVNGLQKEKPSKQSCNGCNCNSKQGLKEELIENVCYACRHIVQELVRQ